MLTEMGTQLPFPEKHKLTQRLGILMLLSSVMRLDEEVELSNGDILLREPIGVCGLITPWNWPINQVTLKVLPAIATGCCCILKPSEHTPISAMIYAEILHEAGCPAGVFNLINGEGPIVGSAMSRHSDIQMISFTGSTRAGSAVTHDAAETVKRVTLELGGKSPNIVFADCNLDERIEYSRKNACQIQANHVMRLPDF